ncbi:DUF3867 domain-containing protein [Clostridium sp. UBA1652]|uniref:DUF3867 domain-containing protein n=1 Tax=Clostridium sp. UBA1652 TaxID=1946348 RepID=UPI002580B89E|nr:DUF3867 domain-containing protein [Clostridium sp. UBA1652]
MDDRIIDFNDLKNKARDKDIDKFETYIYSLYYDLTQGKITMADMMKEINKYTAENNISQEKLVNIQKEIMKRYGFDAENLEAQMKTMGVDLNGANYEEARKVIGFQEKYKNRLTTKSIQNYSIKNSKNDITIYLDNNQVMINSSGKIDLTDNELNEFLCSYKKILKDDKLNISLCENVNNYIY